MNYSRSAGRTRYISVVILYVLLIGCIKNNVPVDPPSIPRMEQGLFVNAISNIKHSIAPVVCVQTHPTGDWDLRSIEGTAFFVAADGSFITPNHVLDGLTLPNRQIPCPSPAIYVPERGDWRVDVASFRIHYALFLTQTCKRDAQLDIAFCTPFPGGMILPGGAPLKVSPVEFDNDPPRDGSPIAFSGFPLSSPVPISAMGSVASYQGNSQGIYTMVIDRAAWPGASGSPIYLPNGHVIGIILARGTGDGTGLAYGRIARFVSTFLPEAYQAID
jgi:hypothetical protein